MDMNDRPNESIANHCQKQNKTHTPGVREGKDNHVNKTHTT